MRRLGFLGVLSLVGLGASATPAAAGVYVRAPFVRVAVGAPLPPRGIVVAGPPVVVVRAPLIRVAVVRPVPVVVPAPVVLPPAPVVPEVPDDVPPVPESATPTLPVPAVVPTKVVPARPPTPGEFAAAFKPAGGNYEVDLLHPFTGRPVRVAFSLPVGAPKQVRVNKLRMEFDYGRRSVVVRFFRDGSVRVRN